MKRSSIILSAVLVLAATACTKQEMVKQQPAATQDGILFHAGFDTRVSTTEGVSTWQSGDNLSVFSHASTSAAGTSVSANIKYVTSDAGASASFVPDAAGVEVADKYFAFYPYTPDYASKLNADNDLGFAGAAANDAVTDYRFMPINVNTGATFEFDPATGESVSTNTKPSFYAAGDAPATPGDPVHLTFKPVLPLLELDLYGQGAFTQVEIMMTDKATDVFAQDNWLTGKGVLDLSTGQFKVTNYSNTAYHKLTVTLKEADKNYIELQGDKPMKMKLVVGHFNITKGLTLTFTKQGGGTIVRKIWADKTVKSVTDLGVAKHIRQGVNVVVPFISVSASSVSEFAAAGGTSEAVTVSTNVSWSIQSKPSWITPSASSGTGGASITFTASANDGSARNGSVVLATPEGQTCSVAVSQAGQAVVAGDYYRVSISDIDFTSSYIYDVKDVGGTLIARITKEYLGSTVDKQVVAVYPTTSSHLPDYTKGLVAEVTLDGGSAPSGDIHGGINLNAKTMTPGNVVYNAGTSAKITTVWISADGSTIKTEQPAGTIAAATVSPFVLTSPSGENTSLVKLGSQIWTAEGYKSTKLGDGTDITAISSSSAPSENQNEYLIASGTGFTNAYLYSCYCVKDGALAPTGWSVPTNSQWNTGVGTYLGGTSTYANLRGPALMFARNGLYKNATAAPALLGYACMWGSAASGSKWVMLLCKENTAPANTTQAMNRMFEVRLVQVIE